MSVKIICFGVSASGAFVFNRIPDPAFLPTCFLPNVFDFIIRGAASIDAGIRMSRTTPRDVFHIFVAEGLHAIAEIQFIAQGSGQIDDLLFLFLTGAGDGFGLCG